jgi:uncharacterized membrane protein
MQAALTSNRCLCANLIPRCFAQQDASEEAADFWWLSLGFLYPAIGCIAALSAEYAAFDSRTTLFFLWVTMLTLTVISGGVYAIGVRGETTSPQEDESKLGDARRQTMLMTALASFLGFFCLAVAWEASRGGTGTAQ